MTVQLNCTHPLASAVGNVSESVLYSLLLEEERQEFVMKIPALVFLMIYVFLGIPGNILVILIYYHRFRSSTTKVFIMSLSTFDLISCVIGLPFEMVDMRFDMELDLPVLCKCLRFVISFCACGSTLILLSVAVDRFRRICRPFKRQMSVKQSKYVLLGMSIFSLLISVPALILYGRKVKIYRGISLVDCTIDDQWAKTGFAHGYQYILGMLWISSIVVLCVMYGIIIFKIRQQETRRLNLTANSLASLTVSKFHTVTSNGNPRNNNAVSNDKGINNLGGSSPSRSHTHTQSRTLIIEQSNSNISTDGMMGNSLEGEDGIQRQSNPLNRLFSRDVNPIYEEEDEATKSSNSRLCDITQSDDDGSERHTDDVSERDDVSEESHNADVKKSDSSAVTLDNDDDRLSFSSGQTVEKNIDVIKIVVKSESQEIEPELQDLKSENENPTPVILTEGYDEDVTMSRAQSCPSLYRGFVHDKIEAKIRRRSCTDDFKKSNNKRSTSIPLFSQTETVNSVIGNERQGMNDYHFHSGKELSTHQTNYYKESDTILHQHHQQTGEHYEYMESGILTSIHKTNTLDVVDKRYASDDKSIDRLTSMSDRTNGSLLTLQDSRVMMQDRHRNFSGHSSVIRQTSVNSSNGSAPNERYRVSKSNSITSRSSGRTHKNSITSTVNYRRHQSVASTRDLKTSKIAKMMFYVTLGHVLSYLPHIAIQFHRILGSTSLALLLCNSVYFAFHHLLLRSIYLNNAINPIIYSYNNVQFRQYCKQVLTKPLKFCRRKSSNYTIDSAHSFTMD